MMILTDGHGGCDDDSDTMVSVVMMMIVTDGQCGYDDDSDRWSWWL